jgi:hypothetical protein
MNPQQKERLVGVAKHSPKKKINNLKRKYLQAQKVSYLIFAQTEPVSIR